MLFIHIVGHALNLSDQDNVKQLKIMEDTTLNTTCEITKLIKKSPKREVLQDQGLNKYWLTRYLYVCPTRCTVKAKSMNSISEKYKAW